MANKYKKLTDEEITSLLSSIPKEKLAENTDLLLDISSRFLKINKFKGGKNEKI